MWRRSPVFNIFPISVISPIDHDKYVHTSGRKELHEMFHLEILRRYKVLHVVRSTNKQKSSLSRETTLMYYSIGAGMDPVLF